MVSCSTGIPKPFRTTHLLPLTTIMTLIKTVLLSVPAILVVTACSTSPKLAAEQPSPATASAANGVANARSVATVNAPAMDALDDPKGLLARRSVYFDYDSYVVRPDADPVLSAHSNYLSHNGARTIIIQGNTDERGGSEYNLALGQKRAEAVRKSLALLGVPNARMEAVSFGKEKPKATGSDESAWAENRRDDIVYSRSGR